MSNYVELRKVEELKEMGFSYKSRSCVYYHDSWGSIHTWDIQIAAQSNYKARLLEYDPGGPTSPPFIRVVIKDRITKLPAIAAKDFNVTGQKQFFAGFTEKPLGRGKKFKVIPTRGVQIDYTDFSKSESEKLFWYLVEYLGAEKMFAKLAKKLGYEIEK